MNVFLSNRHPADLLADVRAEIKQLEIQEAELRDQLLADDADRSGVQWEAVIRTYSQERLDTKAVIKHFGAAISPCLKQVEFEAVTLRRRKSRSDTQKFGPAHMDTHRPAHDQT
jgi:hypothetical protein